MIKEIPGTVRIVLKACDPQRSMHQVVFSVLDRCFLPVQPDQGVIELFDQDSSSVSVQEVSHSPEPADKDGLLPILLIPIESSTRFVCEMSNEMDDCSGR